ncbi:hypothetical protein NA56DRAFT_711679 [Hyaloscypha hepaticicola]|uniref:Uncharacterized protein n=1 Tax=Hyaloscypha hepaticicola TaxID=2082293 RepID=A0A2J6PII5_9HELO|nr:hypothetical protein NA56DRAFT_711679 [Hyaloscypha hepaticicola]
MPIIPDLAGVPGNADLYPHEYSQETAALPLGFRTGVGVRDATLVHDTHGYLEQLSAIPPGNGFLSTSLDPSFSPFQAQGHLSPTQEAQTDLSFQYATPPFTNNYGASDFSLTQEAQTDLSFQYATPPFTTNYGASDFSLTQEAQTDLSFQYATPPFTTNYGASDFSLTQEVQTDLSFQYATPPLTTNYGANDFSLIQDQADFSFQGTAPPLTTNYGASDFFYTGDEYLEVDGSNLFSAPPTPVPTFAPTPALTFEPPTPVSTFEAPTLAPIVGSSSFARFARSEQRRKNRPLSFRAPPIPPSQAAEKQPPVAIGRGPRQVIQTDGHAYGLSLLLQMRPPAFRFSKEAGLYAPRGNGPRKTAREWDGKLCVQVP